MYHIMLMYRSEKHTIIDSKYLTAMNYWVWRYNGCSYPKWYQPRQQDK